MQLAQALVGNLLLVVAAKLFSQPCFKPAGDNRCSYEIADAQDGGVEPTNETKADIDALIIHFAQVKQVSIEANVQLQELSIVKGGSFVKNIDLLGM